MTEKITSIPPGCVSVELLNIERSVSDDLREWNGRLRDENRELKKQLAELQQDPNDCYHRAMPGEPRFTLLARDPLFYKYVSEWAADRERAVLCGDRPPEDAEQAADALCIAVRGQAWRSEHNGEWRKS